MIGIVPIIQQRMMSMAFWSPKMRAFMNHPAGPFTIFFWCPFVKWGITITNLKDIDLPTKQINSYQQTAIAMTGFIFTRYCFVINPVNISLAAVNFFMGCTGLYQLSRKFRAGELYKD